jgi:hypothetical protein
MNISTNGCYCFFTKHVCTRKTADQTDMKLLTEDLSIVQILNKIDMRRKDIALRTAIREIAGISMVVF